MAEPLTTVRNTGPAMERSLIDVGIKTAQELRDLGADEAYLRLLNNGVRPHFIAYYVLVIGLQGRVWNDYQGQEKRDLRLRFDALKEKTKPSACALDSHFEQALDRLGFLPLNRLR